MSNETLDEIDWEIDTDKVLLSILIPSLKTRRSYLAKLKAQLTDQVDPLFTPVEILTDIDNGEASIGTKRNRLMSQKAKGDYVAFIDDDDSISPSYVACLLDGIQTDADAIRFFVEEIRDGRFIRLQRSKLHLSAIKREIAIQVPFADSNTGEDTDWEQRITPLLKQTTNVNKLLYTYYFRSERRGEVSNLSRV